MKARPILVPPSLEVACAAADGCSYLRALSTIEHIAGFGHTARSYAAKASRCREEGCWAERSGGDAPATVPAPALIRLRALHVPRKPAAVTCDRTIPFLRSSLIDIAHDADGNYVERRALKLDTLPARGDPLGYLYLYWRDLRAAGSLQFASIDTVHLARAGVIGKLHIVDVTSGDPGDFRFELSGYALPLGRFEKPRALPTPIYAEAAMRDYNTARLTAVPRLHRMRSRLNGTSYHYTRLILPFLDARGRTNRLVVAVRQEPGDGVRLEAAG